jgi:hypothetical protein
MVNQASRFDNTSSLSISSPAIYQIEIQGKVEEEWSDELAGMNITCMNCGDKIITTLIGKLKDQAALAGLLQTIYEMKFPILSVQYKG